MKVKVDEVYRVFRQNTLFGLSRKKTVASMSYARKVFAFSSTAIKMKILVAFPSIKPRPTTKRNCRKLSLAGPHKRLFNGLMPPVDINFYLQLG